jgi:hypothetical protein
MTRIHKKHPTTPEISSPAKSLPINYFNYRLGQTN